jgi:hypothetical protein
MKGMDFDKFNEDSEFVTIQEEEEDEEEDEEEFDDADQVDEEDDEEDVSEHRPKAGKLVITLSQFV